MGLPLPLTGSTLLIVGVIAATATVATGIAVLIVDRRKRDAGISLVERRSLMLGAGAGASYAIGGATAILLLPLPLAAAIFATGAALTGTTAARYRRIVRSRAAAEPASLRVTGIVLCLAVLLNYVLILFQTGLPPWTLVPVSAGVMATVTLLVAR